MTPTYKRTVPYTGPANYVTPERRTIERRINHKTNELEQRFAEEYFVDMDPEAAAERSGLTRGAGARFLAKKNVQEYLAIEASRRASRTQIHADEIQRRWWMLATADARELVQLRRICCRYCYGIDNRYQYTQEELRQAVAHHKDTQVRKGLREKDWVPFDDQGGEGYDRTADPNAECPECRGEGVPTVWLEDSRNYSQAAAYLFDGVEVGKDGSIKIKMRDRAHAMDRAAQQIGMLVQRRAVLTLDPTKLTDDQLEMVLKQFENLTQPASSDAETIEHEAVYEEVDEQAELE